MIKALLVALLLVPATVRAEVRSYSDFSGGLNTRNSGILLQDNESPDLQNVVLDENGGISRRKGITKINSTYIGDGSSDVNAVYQLELSNGNKYCVSFSSTSGYYSTDGCQTNTVFVSTLTRNNDVNCDPYGDKLYCVNNQYDFSFDGTNDAAFAGPSDLNFIKVFRNRCFGAGKDTNPSRLYWSNLGTCETWTTASDYVDIDAEDGDVITGISELFNFLVVFKKFSTYLIQFDNANPNNRKVINVSRCIGAKNHRNIMPFSNRLYFLSVGCNGGQPGVYSTDGILVQEDTQKLRGSIDTLSNFFSNTGRKLIDTKDDWDSGSFSSYALSSSRDQGLMQSSYTSVGQTTSADFLSGTIVSLATVPFSGSLVLYPAATSTVIDTFSDGNVTSNIAWTDNGGNWTVVSGAATRVQSGAPRSAIESTALSQTAATAAFGNWSIDVVAQQADATIGAIDGNGSAIVIFKFINVSTGGDGYYVKLSYTGSSYSLNLQLFKRSNSVETQLGSDVTVSGFSAAGSKTLRVYRDPLTSAISVYWDGSLKITASDTTFNTAAGSLVGLATQGNSLSTGFEFDNYSSPSYPSSGTYTQPIFDTAISTPIGGVFSSTFSAPAGTQINFYIRESTSPNNDMWSSYSATSDTLHIVMSKRYQQLQAQLFTTMSTMTPRLDAFGYTASSTGTWTSPELFLSNSMTSFGLFQADQTTTGSAASIGYAMKISTYAGGTASTGTIVVTPGSSIAHSTGAYVVIIATYTIYSASETSKTDSIVINWNEGTSAKSATMAVYKNRLHFCGQTASASVNDVCYVRDMNGAWVRWTGIAARYLNTVGQSFMAGGSSETSGGYIYKLYDTDSDAGAAIDSYWESKDMILTDKIQNVKAIDRLYVLGSNDATTLTTTLKADSGLRTQSFDLAMSTGAAFRIINKPVPSPINGNTFRVRFENNAASKPWSIFGFGLMYRDLGLMQP